MNNKPMLRIVGVVAVLALVGVYMYIRNAPVRPVGSTKSVLFVGNSFTSVNDLPKTVADIATSLGDTVVYDSSAPGGYTLMQHATYPETVSKIESKKWDFVVLQDQSEMPALSDSRVKNEVLPYAVQLNTLIHSANSNTKTVFFETWGYENGDSQYCVSSPTLCSYTAMQDQLLKSYTLMAQETDNTVVKVGEAWRLARANYSEIQLYDSDGKHPSLDGTYLAACVFYMTLFNKDVIGASHLSISWSHAKILQQIARHVVWGK